MIEKLLEKRRGHGISDEDEEAYLLGIKDALSALVSDEVYYEVCDAKQSWWTAVTKSVEFVKGEWFK